MESDQHIADLQREIVRLEAENKVLREMVWRGSKTEAMFAFEYDRIPNFLKTERAIRFQRHISTAAMYVFPVLLVAGVIAWVIGVHQFDKDFVEGRRRLAESSEEFRHNVDETLPH